MILRIGGDDYLASSGFSGKLLKCNGRGSKAGSEEPWQKVRFHGSSVEPVVEFGDVALEVLGLDLMMGSEQEALQVRERDVDPGKEFVGRLGLA